MASRCSPPSDRRSSAPWPASAGQPVAIVANNPASLAGSVDADGADKAAHFISVADSFHLPLVFLADNPGVLPGGPSEQQGVLRSGARMFVAQTSPPRRSST